MIKVTFKEPQLLVIDNLCQDCLFVLGFKVNINVWNFQSFDCSNIELENKLNSKLCGFRTDNIKSIEHVKPTDL